jgi:hypothetical protein
MNTNVITINTPAAKAQSAARMTNCRYGRRWGESNPRV